MPTSLRWQGRKYKERGCYLFFYKAPIAEFEYTSKCRDRVSMTFPVSTKYLPITVGCKLRCLGISLIFVSTLRIDTVTAETLQVGPQRSLKTPSAAAARAKAGSIIEIDAGVYENDYSTWSQDSLTIRGTGGMVHMKSNGLIPNGKAIWIIRGGNTAIENVEFSGAKVEDKNGAGIRHERGHLHLRNTFFHHNEFSVLTGSEPGSTLAIESSRIWHQKRVNTYSHGIYVGALQRFTLRNSHVMGTDRGHQIKSRALENYIIFNTIEDAPQGNSSRLIDLPNCGLSYVVGNTMFKARMTENISAIGYGAEGCGDRSDRQRQLYVVENKFVNEASRGILVNNHVAARVRVANNWLIGRGVFLKGSGKESDNVQIPLALGYENHASPPSGTQAKKI